jgi:hypothetical protein
MTIRKRIVLALAFCLTGALAASAADLNQGTWKLNEAKSKIPAGAQKNVTVTYSMDGDNVKAVVDGVDGAGNATHNEWTGKYDGKDYPVTGDATSDSRALKKVNDHKYELTAKKDGKVTLTGTLELSADGKTRTLKLTSTDAKGKKVTSTSVYDKQ